MEAIESILAALGIKLKLLVAGVVTSFVSLKFFDKETKVTERWLTVVGGTALAVWASEPISVYFELPPEKFEVAFAVGFGLFGMAVASQVIYTIKTVKWAEAVSGLFGKKGGDQ